MFNPSSTFRVLRESRSTWFAGPGPEAQNPLEGALMKTERPEQIDMTMVQRKTDERIQGAGKDLQSLDGANFQTISQMLTEGVKNFREAVARKATNLQSMIPELNKIFLAYRQQAPDKQKAEESAQAFAESMSKQMQESDSQASLRFDSTGGFTLIVRAEATATATSTNTITNTTDNRPTFNNTVVMQPQTPEKVRQLSEAEDLAALKTETARYQAAIDRYAGRLAPLQSESLKNDWVATINTTLESKGSGWRVAGGPRGETWLTPYKVKGERPEAPPSFETLDRVQYNLFTAKLRGLDSRLRSGMPPAGKAAEIRRINQEFAKKGVALALVDDVPGSTLPRIIQAPQLSPGETAIPRRPLNAKSREAPPPKPSTLSV